MIASQDDEGMKSFIRSIVDAIINRASAEDNYVNVVRTFVDKLLHDVAIKMSAGHQEEHVRVHLQSMRQEDNSDVTDH